MTNLTPLGLPEIWAQSEIVTPFVPSTHLVGVTKEIEDIMLTTALDLIDAEQIKNIALIIRNLGQEKVVQHLSNLISLDPLLEDVFTLQENKIIVKELGSNILDAHFGETMKVVPGVIIKRIIQRIFSINLYSQGTYGLLFQTDFVSALKPGDTISFGFPNITESEETSENPQTWELFNLVAQANSTDNPRVIANIRVVNKSAYHNRILERLDLVTSVDMPVKLDSSQLDKHLAQKPLFRFATNVENRNTQLSLYSSTIDLNVIRERSWSLELLEEAICQAITLGAQSKEEKPEESLITLCSSRMIAHEDFSGITGDIAHLTFQILPGATKRGYNVYFLLKSDEWIPIAEGQIEGNRLSKRSLQRKSK